MAITSRENWKRFLRGEKTEWLPLVSEVQTIHPDINPEFKARGFVMEARKMDPAEYGGPDIYGVPWVFEPLAGGSMEDPAVPPILKDIEDWPDIIQFPDVDSWDWEGAAARNRDFMTDDRLKTTTILTGIFERLIAFMGFEGAAMTLIDEDYEEELQALLTKVTDINIQIIAKMKQYFDIDLIVFHDDWGGQLSPFFSIDTCRRVILPHMRRVSDFCHSHDILFELHSCGHNDTMVPCMIEAGVDAWCGQPMCDKYALWEQYGDQIAIGLNFTSSDPEVVGKEIDYLVSRLKEHPEKRMYIRDRARGVTIDIGTMVREKTRCLYE